MAIITLKNITVSFGTDVVLDGAELVIEKGDRLCITGRNGTGKSTLLKLLAGELTPDDGQLWRQESLRFATLEQDLPASDDTMTVYQSVAEIYQGMGELLAEYHTLLENLVDDKAFDRLSYLQQEIEAKDGWTINHRIESILDRMDLDADKPLSELSGGWLKRVAIARSLVTQPDVWMLDEPTNHLDIPAIQWLEEQLLSFDGTVIFISHDRELMQSVATSILDIDRGTVTRWECDYKSFIERRDHQREVEQVQNRKFDDNLKKEEVWIRQGIKARRTRNEGRVRALLDLRKERSKRREVGTLKMEVDAGMASGKIVKELINVSKSFGDQCLVDNFNFILQRSDRIGLIGANGVGKSTLLKILLDELEVDQGEVRTGTKLNVAYFDQTRDQLNPEQSVSDYISEGREYITIGGKDIHVVSYLGNFMFSGDQARAPIRTLSGGEQNRLLLARLFSLPANLLVLDEPTNDLDIESLELLEELMLEFKGTVLIVSHDRSFMDNVVSSLLVFEGEGVVREFVGGYSDWIASGGDFSVKKNSTPAVVKIPDLSQEEKKRANSERKKLEKELAELPGKIEKKEKQQQQFHDEMAKADFYERPDSEQRSVFQKLSTVESDVETLMDRWEEIEVLIAAASDS